MGLHQWMEKKYVKGLKPQDKVSTDGKGKQLPPQSVRHGGGSARLASITS